MKCETALARIQESDSSDKVKAMKLWKLAARQVTGSYNQELVRKHWEIYYEKAKGEKTMEIKTEELLDADLRKLVRFTDATQQDVPKTEKKETEKKSIRQEKVVQKPKYEPVNARWEPIFEPVKKDPDFMDKLKACTKCAAVCGGLNMLLFYWQQTGQMAFSAAVPSMCVCMLICGIGIGRNWWR